MAPVRLRGPNGISTIQLDLKSDTYTVQDLQQEILKATSILPSRQILKCGYPPRSLTVVPELPISSLGLAQGDQIIVSEDASREPPPPPPRAPSPGRAPVRNSPAIPDRPTQSAAPPQASSSSGPEHVPTADGSFLVHRVVPDDNSCLFSSVALIFEQDISKASKIRQVVADGIRKDQETYNEAILGQPIDSYISTILKPTTWGGAIELSILAAHYATEISSIDVETGRIDHFTPVSGDTGMRCVVIYSGIHYDAATLAPMVEAPNEWHQTVFPVVSKADDDSVLQAGRKLADKLRAKRAYTNTTTFTLKCENCGKGLTGQKEATEHAKETGHTNFGEY